MELIYFLTGTVVFALAMLFRLYYLNWRDSHTPNLS